MKPLVSIIITNYNYGAYIAEAIESALAQTFADREIMVTDDSSTDNSLEIASRYPVQILKQDNGGLSLARNNALVHARGEYVLFLDADDRLPEHAIIQLADSLGSATNDVAYAYGQMQYFDLQTDVFKSREFDAKQLFKSNYVCATTLLRKEVLVRAGGYDNGFRTLREDWELYIRLWRLGYKGIFIQQITLECRKHKPHVRRSLAVKALSMAKLIYLYPSFFWKQWLRHPLRYTYYMIVGKVWNSTRDYGDKAELHGLRVVKDIKDR